MRVLVTHERRMVTPTRSCKRYMSCRVKITVAHTYSGDHFLTGRFQPNGSRDCLLLVGQQLKTPLHDQRRQAVGVKDETGTIRVLVTQDGEDTLNKVKVSPARAFRTKGKAISHPELIRLLQHDRVLGNSDLRASSRYDLSGQLAADHALSSVIFFRSALRQLVPEAHRAGIKLLLDMGDQQLDGNLILETWYDLVTGHLRSRSDSTWKWLNHSRCRRTANWAE
jgi:hypothetical protein